MITFAESLQFNYSDFCRTAAADIAGFLERCTEADRPGLPYFDITLPHRQQSVMAYFVYPVG